MDGEELRAMVQKHERTLRGLRPILKGQVRLVKLSLDVIELVLKELRDHANNVSLHEGKTASRDEIERLQGQLAAIQEMYAAQHAGTDRALAQAKGFSEELSRFDPFEVIEGGKGEEGEEER